MESEGIPVTENNDLVDLVAKVGNLVGAKAKRSDISITHCLPPKRHFKVGDPPGVIARFISQNVRNEIYSKRAVVKNVDKKDFPLLRNQEKKLFTNENLTKTRKRLLWLTKQKVKAKDYSYIRTMDGRIYRVPKKSERTFKKS